MIFNVALKFWLIRPWHWYRWYPCGFFAYFLFYFFCSFFWLFLALAVRQSAALIGPSKTMAKLPMTLHCGGARKDVGGGFFSLFGGSAGSDDSFIVGYYYHFIAAWMGGNIVIATSCIFFCDVFSVFFSFLLYGRRQWDCDQSDVYLIRPYKHRFVPIWEKKEAESATLYDRMTKWRRYWIGLYPQLQSALTKEQPERWYCVSPSRKWN